MIPASAFRGGAAHRRVDIREDIPEVSDGNSLREYTVTAVSADTYAFTVDGDG